MSWEDKGPHVRAFIVISVALVLDTIFGLCFAAAQHISVWLGLYCALANAVTVGGTVPEMANGSVFPAAHRATWRSCFT